MTPEEKHELTEAIVSALKEDSRMLTDEERRWVRLAIEKEAQAVKLRQAIINHTLTGLSWMLLVYLGSALIKGLGVKV